MALLEALNAELIAEIADGEALAVAGGPWLDSVLSTVFPDLAEGLRTRPVARDKPRPRSDIDSPWGPRPLQSPLIIFACRAGP